MEQVCDIRRVPAVRAIGTRGALSLWDVDSAFSKLYDAAMEGKLLFREPAMALRHGALRTPGTFRTDIEVLFPLTADPAGPVPGAHVRELPEEEAACYVHRGPYPWIPCSYEKVLDWVRENGYEVAGTPREIFFVAPEPHSGGTQDDMLTEIQVPIRKAA